MGGFSRIVDFDASSNTYNMGSSSNTNSRFVLKEDAAGNFLWAKQFPSLSVSTTTSWSINNPRIILDAAKNIYLFDVHIDSVDADPGPATYPLPYNGTIRSCIIKLDSTGNFIWAKEIYGSGTTTGTYAIITGAKIDTVTNNIYLTMSVGGTIDVDPGVGVYNVVTPPNSVNPLNNNANVVIVKLDTAGNFIWAKQITGTGNQGAAQLAIDNQHNVYIAGAFTDTADFDPGQGVANLIETSTMFLPQGDVFIAKYDSAGNYIWAKQVGANGDDKAWDLSLDPWGDVVVSGQFNGTVDFDPGAGVYNLTSNSTRSIFTLKLRNNGDFAWAQKAGYNTGLYEGRGITTDTAGNVYVVSNTYPMQKFDSSGNLLWTLATAGANGWIALDNNNSIYLSGSFIGGNVDFDPGPGFYCLTAASPGGGFILKLSQNTPTTTLTASADTVCAGDTVWLTTPIIPEATRYYWSKNGTYFNDTNTIAVTASGNYKVTVYGGECPLESNVVHVYVAPMGNTSLTLSAPAMASPGQGVTVNAALTDPGSNYAIDWYRNGILLATNASPAYSFVKTAVDDTVYAVLHPQTLCYDTAIMSDTVIILTEKTDTSMAAAHLSLQATHIYPNPFDNTLTVSGLQPGDKIWLLDATGRVLLRKEAESISENIDVKEVAAGYYIIKLYAKEGNVKGNVPVVKR